MRTRGPATSRARGAGSLLSGTILLLSGSQARAGDWDLSSFVAVRQSWTENTTFTARPGNGDAISTLSLSGRAVRKTSRSKFESSYAPAAIFYRDRTDLNRISHLARASFSYEATARSTLVLNESYTFVPDQGVSGDTLQSALLFTRLTDRRNNTSGAGYQLKVSPTTSLFAEVRESYQTFSDPTLIDSASTSSGLRLDHSLGARSGLEFGVRQSWSRFSLPRLACTVPAPNGGCLKVDYVRRYQSAQIPSVFVGGRQVFGRRLSGTARIGSNFVNSSDPKRPTRHGIQALANLQWKGSRLTAQGGYNQEFSAGSGALTVSRTETYHAGLALILTQSLTGTLLINRSSSRTLRSTGSQEIATTNGQAELAWQIRPGLSALAGFTRYLQDSQQTAAPQLGFNRYTVGLIAGFN